MSARYLITDSVPLNGGDEALLRALLQSIRARWPDTSIMVLAKDVERCREHLPDIDFDSDLTFIEQDSDRAIDCMRVRRLYEEADLVISSPGGFLNDHYRIDGRLRAMQTAVDVGTPLVIFGQSIGPFWIEESKRAVRRVLGHCHAICVRDRASLTALRELGIDANKILPSTDVAFLWHRLSPPLFDSRSTSAGDIHSIGTCFRLWPLRDNDQHEPLIVRATTFIEMLMTQNPNLRLTFISTCQGISGYKDDSEVAHRVQKRLSPGFRDRCTIDCNRYSPPELIRQLSRHDAFIGMRLHACLLAMLGGCPAMGLGYEPKTREIFTELGFGAYQVDHSAELNEWFACATRFLASIEEIQRQLPAALDAAAQRVEESLAILDPAALKMNARVVHER